MAHHGYIPFASMVTELLETPRVLEIGVDKGITTFSMLHRLSLRSNKFTYVAVDILIRPEVLETVSYMGLDLKKNDIFLLEENSLVALPQFVKNNLKFDLIFLDGDHNYYTAQNELREIKNLIHEDTIIIADDYHGRWSNTDGFYCDYDDMKNNKKATPKKIAESKENQGVNQAIDNFILENTDFSLTTLMEGEPVIIFNKKNRIMKYLGLPK